MGWFDALRDTAGKAADVAKAVAEKTVEKAAEIADKTMEAAPELAKAKMKAEELARKAGDGVVSFSAEVSARMDGKQTPAEIEAERKRIEQNLSEGATAAKETVLSLAEKGGAFGSALMETAKKRLEEARAARNAPTQENLEEKNDGGSGPKL